MTRKSGSRPLTHLYQHSDHAAITVNPDGEIVPRDGWTLLQPKTSPHLLTVATQEYFPWSSERLRRHEILVIDSLDDLPPEAKLDRKSFAQFGLPPGELTLKRFLRLVHPEDRAAVEAVYRSCTDGAPVEVEYRLVESDASVRWLYSRVRQQFDFAGRPTQVMGITLDVTKQKEMARRQEEQLREISRLKKRLEAEVVVLRDQLKTNHVTGDILGTSDAIEQVLIQVEQVATRKTTVLILGETGTGKNLVAAAIHARSRRKDRPLVTVNCAALPANLIENELFGRDRGVFTGADRTHAPGTIRARRPRVHLPR